jgi:hypothetical protein
MMVGQTLKVSETFRVSKRALRQTLKVSETFRVSKRALALLLIAHLALTIAYSAIVPLGEAPDEADHWAYIVHLARERNLPEGPAMTQAKHPPLYHATAALIASLAEPRFDFLRANPDVQIAAQSWGDAAGPNFFVHTALEEQPWRDGPLAFHLARLWSAVLSTLTVWATFRLMRTALPKRPAVALAAAGLLAFLPEFAFIGGSANNDNLAALCGALALWGGLAMFRAARHAGRGASADEKLTPRRQDAEAARSPQLPLAPFAPLRETSRAIFTAGWWTPLALGFGLLAKVSTAALWPMVAVAILAGVWMGEAQGAATELDGRQERSVAGKLSRVLLRSLITGLWVFLPALLLAAPWFWRNWTLYGDPLGMELARQTVDVRAGPWTAADTAWLLRGWFVSFWGKFGGAGHIPMAGWLYSVLAALTALAVAGMMRAALRSRARDERQAVGLLGLAAVLTALGIWRYSLIALGTDQGRLLYPAAAGLAGLLALGWLAWVPPRREALAATALTALSLALGCYALLGVIRPAFAPPASAGRPSPQFPAAATLGELTLLGADLDGEPTLYWTAASRPTQDWRVIVRIVAENGAAAWEWKRSPGAGRFSADRWPAGYVMRDVYRVAWPAWAGPGRYRVEATVYPFGGEPVAPFLHVGWLTR